MSPTVPALIVLVAVALAACGGGTSSATSTAVSAPTATAKTVTVAASPASGNSTGTPGSTGGGGGAVGTSIASPAGTRTSGATPTRRPATVIATPRKIATKPPTAVPNPTATTAEAATAVATAAATADASGATLLLGQDFSSDAAPFFVGTTDSGVITSVANGVFSIQVPVNIWSVIASNQTSSPPDGLIVADVALAPNSFGGVFGRYLVAADGTYSVYICWISTDGNAGCRLNVNNVWTSLFELGPGAVTVQDVNTLTMSIVGGEITFAVGNTIVGSATDPTITAGYWGMYAQSPTETAATIVFDNVGIYQVPATFKLGQ